MWSIFLPELVFSYSPVTAFQLQMTWLSLTFSLDLFFFFFSPPPYQILSHHFCLPFMPQTFHPRWHPTTTNTSPRSPPSSILQPTPLQYLSNLHTSHCLLAAPKMRSTTTLLTIQSPLMSGEPVGIWVLLLIIAFTGEPSSACAASEGGRMKGRRSIKVCQMWLTCAAFQSEEQIWHTLLPAMSGK